MKSSIQTQKTTRALTMTPRQQFWYWAIMLFFLAFPIYATIDLLISLIQHKTTLATINEGIVFGYLFLLPAFLFHAVQKNHLKFKVLDVRLDEANFQEVVLQAARWMEWKIIESSDGHLVAKNPISYRSIGERITIFREGQQVFFNSMGNPDTLYTIPYTSINRRLRKMFENQVKEILAAKQQERSHPSLSLNEKEAVALQ